MSVWTHIICKKCYNFIYPGRQPITIKDPEEEKCCKCGIPNRDGVFLRGNPNEFNCKGVHA